MILNVSSCDFIKINSGSKPLEVVADPATPEVPAEPEEPETPVVCTPSKKIDHFAIYYGWPSSLNSATNAWTMSNVITDLSRYESVVLGAGLEDNTHVDYANTLTLLAGATTPKFFGYIAIGNVLSINDLQTKIDNWSTMPGIDGIFIDEFGMDFKVSAGGISDADYRIRQKAILDYVHGKGLVAFINAFDPDDIFIKESGNPLTISTGDRYLYESYYLSSTTRETWSFYRAKVAKLKAAKIAFPQIKIMANTSTATNNFTQDLFDTVVLAAAVDEIDGIAWSEFNYSATDAVMPFRTPSTTVNLFCTQDLVVDATAKSLDFILNTQPVKILYNASGSPTHQ